MPRFTLPEHRAQNIRPRLVFARAEAEADFFRDQIFHRAKAFDKFRQQRRAGGRDEFVRLVALGDADAARAENRQRGRRGNGKSSVRAINPAGAFDHRRGQHARFAEQFQRDARADDVHDGIHRADFVEMDFAPAAGRGFCPRPRRCAGRRRWISASPTPKACCAEMSFLISANVAVVVIDGRDRCRVRCHA